MKKKYPIRSSLYPLFILIFLFCSILLHGEEEEIPEEKALPAITYHSLGDQAFAINAGLGIPLFFENPNAYGNSSYYSSTNLGLGGTGSLYYGGYLSNNWQIGMEVGAFFSSGPNKHTFYMIPVTVRGSYEFQIHNNMFSIPLYLGFGMNMTSYQESFHVEMICKPGTAFYWNFGSNWSFGARFTYWWIPQLYGSSSENRFGNFMDVSLSAVYNF